MNGVTVGQNLGFQTPAPVQPNNELSNCPALRPSTSTVSARPNPWFLSTNTNQFYHVGSLPSLRSLLQRHGEFSAESCNSQEED